MSQMKQTTVQITVADLAEEAMALNDFYRQRVLAVQSMRRTAVEQVEALTAKLAELTPSADDTVEDSE